MGRRTARTVVLASTLVVAGGCTSWPQGRTAAPEGIYVMVLNGRAGHVDVEVITPEPRPYRLGAGDALGQMVYGTWLASLKADELDPGTRTVTAPDPFLEFVGDP